VNETVRRPTPMHRVDGLPGRSPDFGWGTRNHKRRITAGGHEVWKNEGTTVRLRTYWIVLIWFESTIRFSSSYPRNPRHIVCATRYALST
jgi:hypothetical protein